MKKIIALATILVSMFVMFSTFDETPVLEREKSLNQNIAVSQNLELETLDECDSCMSLASETCVNLYTDCFNLDDCSEYLACDHYVDLTLNHSGCYPQCQTSFVETGSLSDDLKTCACSLCEFECEASCNFEG